MLRYIKKQMSGSHNCQENSDLREVVVVMIVVVGSSRDIDSLQGWMDASQSTRQVEGSFESLLAESFGGG